MKKLIPLLTAVFIILFFTAFTAYYNFQGSDNSATHYYYIIKGDEKPKGECPYLKSKSELKCPYLQEKYNNSEETIPEEKTEREKQTCPYLEKRTKGNRQVLKVINS